MDLVEALTRKLAKRAVCDGAVGYQTDGDAVLVAAFEALGWTDPHVDPEPEPEPIVEAAPEPAPESAPESAPEPVPEG